MSCLVLLCSIVFPSPLFYHLRLRFSLPLIKIRARIDRPQMQRNWQRPRIKTHQSPHINWPQLDHHVFAVFSKKSGLLHWLLAAKWRTCNSLFGLNFRTCPHRTLRKKEEKTKFGGPLVESVVFEEKIIKSTFDYWIEAEYADWIVHYVNGLLNQQNHFSINESISSLATGTLTALAVILLLLLLFLLLLSVRTVFLVVQQHFTVVDLVP